MRPDCLASELDCSYGDPACNRCAYNVESQFNNDGGYLFLINTRSALGLSSYTYVSFYANDLQGNGFMLLDEYTGMPIGAEILGRSDLECRATQGRRAIADRRQLLSWCEREVPRLTER